MHSSAHPENSFWTSGEAPGKEIALKTENSNLLFARRGGETIAQSLHRISQRPDIITDKRELQFLV